MNTTTLKKLLAILAVAAMLVCVLAGCGDQTAPQQTAPATGEQTQNNAADTNPNGMLVLSTEASVKITYDADGMVLAVEGINDYGIILADEYTDYEGKSCADAVKELLVASVNSGNLSPDVKNVVIKLAVGSTQPGTNFLETIGTAAQDTLTAEGSSAKVTLIDVADLDEEGYISLDTAKALLMNQLGVEKLDAYYGSETPSNGAYVCTVDVGGVESAYSIDAVTGLIGEATEEDLMNDPEATEPSEEYEYNYEEEIIYEETQGENYTEPTVTDPVVTEPVVEEPGDIEVPIVEETTAATQG